MALNPEQSRLLNTVDNSGWKKWGPYVTERQWGTVREDYSEDGSAWEFISHDKARSNAYRWGEEGIAGVCDNKQKICFALSMWNGKDNILKERLFGLTGNEGNHGEDVKEYYYYLDSTPTHSYMKMLYKYPQQHFPYDELVAENRKRSKKDPEYELIDTGIFDNDDYFDVFVEYAKNIEEGFLVNITVHNRGAEDAEFHALPTVWFRNNWTNRDKPYKPVMYEKDGRIVVEYKNFGLYYLFFEDGYEDVLFCENETNMERVYGVKNTGTYYKDGIGEWVINKKENSVNPEKVGTKASIWYKKMVPAGENISFKIRFTQKDFAEPFDDFGDVFQKRIMEADLFYDELQKDTKDEELRKIQRQAYAGMLWTKQFYYYDVFKWINGDSNGIPPSERRKEGRNRDWQHLSNMNIISMPDKWEYPWYAAWDLAFHCIPLARLDPAFTKRQLSLLLREYYMHPNGQIPAYEWSFSDVNPPVHAWACWRVFEIDREKNNGRSDIEFLETVYHKLLMNFTWWVNQKDHNGSNLFEGGFLGLDNIGIFDRSGTLPTSGVIQQSDATSWMAMYSLNMLRIALELASYKSSYQEAASKFFQHFLFISGAMNNVTGKGVNLWNEDENFFFDVLHKNTGEDIPMKVRSLVGLIPLFAVEVLNENLYDNLDGFRRRAVTLMNHRPELAATISRLEESNNSNEHLLSLLRGFRLNRILERMLDPEEFLSDYGIRSLSKYHEKHPYELEIDKVKYSVSYLPGESDSGMFGGNSNWRGPIWFPMNFLIIESLLSYYEYYGDSMTYEYPTRSGNMKNLKEIAEDLSRRLISLFVKQDSGNYPYLGTQEKMQKDVFFNDHYLFHEFFHGDTGKGLGASHQTGWTGLVAELIGLLGQKGLEKEAPERK